MRTVVYFGRQRLSTDPDKNYDLLHPLLDLVTTLDPHFTVAYRFGAVFLSERYPDGPFRPDQAIDLLKRGAARNPTRWQYPHDVGFVYYFALRDYTQASEWFSRASEIPNSPIWLRSMAAVALTRGGDREASRFLWRQLHDGAEAEAIRENALFRLAQLDAFDAIDALNQAVARYQAQAGRFPESWGELIGSGLLRQVPADPAGVPFVLDPANQDVRIARESPLWLVPEGMEDYRQ
jgi:tetratricopeptide (TPR) repeat protein